jgi:replicative DNA helicase
MDRRSFCRRFVASIGALTSFSVAPISFGIASEKILMENGLKEMFARNRAVTGVPTGFQDLDRLLAGLQPSDLIIIGGRPAMGKTSFATRFNNYAHNT